MKRAQITLRSGAQITVDVDDMESTKDHAGLTKLTWTTPDGCKARLFTISIDQIDAIVIQSDGKS